MRTIVAILLVAGATIFTASGTAHAMRRNPDITMHSHMTSGPRHHAVKPGHRSIVQLSIITSCEASVDGPLTTGRQEQGAISLCLPRAAMAGRHMGVVSV